MRKVKSSMPVANASSRQQVVGLRDIAEQLNVSVSLVSKVLSGRLGTSGANESKIIAIKEKAREMGYQKNLLAEALRTGRQNVLALFLHRHGEPGSAIVDEVIVGIAEEANRADQRLSIHYYETSAEFRAFVPRMHRHVVDGVIVGGLPHAEIVADLKTIHKRSIPVVTIHDEELDVSLTNVGISQSDVTRIATLHLIDQGCRAIAHYRVADSFSSLPVNRYRGYRMALEERGLPYRPELVVNVQDFSYETGLAAAAKLVETGHRFDGVVGQSDQHGLATINYLISRGMKVPQDVKVTGVDNAPFCRYGVVPLSSVSQEYRVRGKCAAQLLMDKLNGNRVQSLHVAPVLTVRASSHD